MNSESGINTNQEKKFSILIAEDEEYNYLFLAEVLNSYEVTLIRAINGKEAVEQCSTPNDIKIILMDIRMPVMDGYEATKLIKKMHPEMPIIAQTAYAMESDRKRAFKEGFNDYLPKPIRRKELISTIIKHIPKGYLLKEKALKE